MIPRAAGFGLMLMLSWAKRPQIPPHWSCRGQVDWPSLRMLQEQVGRMMEHELLPVLMLEGGSQKYWDFLFQENCHAARWTVELLYAELGMIRAELSNDWADALGSAGMDINHPFAIFFRRSHPSMDLFHEIMWGAGSAWSSVSAGGWGTFALLGRLSKAFQVYLQKQGKPAREAVEAIMIVQPTETRRTIAAGISRVLTVALAGLQHANASAPWEHRAAAAAAAETLLRRWSRAATYSGLPPWQILGSLLLDAQAPKFFQFLDAILLPDAVRICLPQVLGLRSSCRCRAGHCSKFWGRDQALAAAAGNHSNKAGDLAIFRVVPKRGLLNDNFRSKCNVTCPKAVLGLLGEVSELFMGQSVPRTPFVYVDVGAALGDCMMSASFLFPEGRLQGIAFEAIPVWASRMRETFRINGISAEALPNRTQVLVRSVFLGSEKSRSVYMAGGWGLGGSSGATDPGSVGSFQPLTLRTSTLDDEVAVSGIGRVDLLHIFVNAVEPAVLQGARRLLQQHRVGCALVQTYLRQDITGPVVRVLRSSGYTVSNYSYAIPENAFQLVAGSPADALALAGGSACGRRFFQWWLGENREIESDCKMKKEQGRDREERPTQRQNCTGTSRFAQTYRTRAHTHKSHHSGWEPRT
ncbi:unnamed protein product [Symbiodinium necroappetens]|uniref:Methyltransferase FkbM domain-containing protein n=1 Tax=Symbiodinium necroappetens TaxID=1628268 RepID=A0A812K8D6_9DINO|nr:unnamed protein product [Symbiodinium necroappetens]